MKTQIRALVLFGCSTVTALLIGIVSPTGPTTEKVIISLGYLITALCCGTFIYSLKVYLPDARPDFKIPIRANLGPVSAILLTGLWLLSIEPYAFKIIIDEILIASNSQMMHLTRTPTVPRASHWSAGEFATIEAFLDKRPFLLPFLTSLLHDLSGYRLSNVFIVNTALLFGFLTTAFVWVNRAVGRLPAYLFLVLIAFFPVMGQGATGGNASILNLFLLSTNLLLAQLYYKRPSPGTLLPLVFGLILLAQTRYESILYILPFGILILMGWKKANSIILPKLTFAVPFFLVLNLVHIRYTIAYSGFYWQSGPNSRKDTFSFSYLTENLQDTWDFLFNLDFSMPNSLILTVFGICGLFTVLILILKKRLPEDQLSAAGIVLGIFFVNLMVVLLFNYGLFTVYATSRLSMPMHFFLCLFAAIAFAHAPRMLLGGSIFLALFDFVLMTKQYSAMDWSEKGWCLTILIPILLGAGYILWRKKGLHPKFMLLFTLILSFGVMTPKLRSKPYYWNYPSPHYMSYFIDFIKNNKSTDTLFVSIYRYLPTLLELNSLAPEDLVDNKEDMMNALKEGHYQRIYLLHAKAPPNRSARDIDLDKYMELLPEFAPDLVQQKRIAPGIFAFVQELKLKEELPVDVSGQQDKLQDDQLESGE